MKKNKNKKIDKQKLYNYGFLVIIVLIFIVIMFNFALNRNKINYYENRTSYQFPKITLEKYFNKKFQNEVELFFSDQLPLSTLFKKINNLTDSFILNKVAKIGFSNSCKNRYINLNNFITRFGCDGNLVYHQVFLKDKKDKLDIRIDNINEALNGSDVDTYFYYIEKDSDINFISNKKSDLYNYLKENIKSDNIYRFEINSFDEFKNEFYKTDHHWNNRGSYRAYKELVKILTDDEPLNFKEEICLNDRFSGSKASFSGARFIYKEKFCVYDFDYPDYKIKVNGKVSDYGNQKFHIENPNKEVSYGGYYGFDNGEIIIDNNRNDRKNILIIGESYDNAILKLIANHFNKTYSIDLRNYERENKKKFNYNNYINDNSIDLVLFIGNIGFYDSTDFNLEV